MPEPRGLRGWLEASWYSERQRAWLRPAALLYGVALRARAWLYRRRGSVHPGVPTIVIGNLTVGGTGKTPLVIWLAGCLRAQGRRPGIVLRGYGGSQRAARLVQVHDDPDVVGDEALLLARRTQCQVAIGVHRAAAAALLVQSGCDMVIADDGLQHRALARDLEILLIDGARGFGNGALLPAGPLRELPALDSFGGLVVLHGADRRGVMPPGSSCLSMRLCSQPLRQVADDGEVPLESLRGRRVHALAGIGNPQRFFAQLRAVGADPIEHPLPDHHRYRARELTFGDGLWIVMTEKDAVKCRRLAGSRADLLYLPVAAELPAGDAARLLGRVLAIEGN